MGGRRLPVALHRAAARVARLSVPRDVAAGGPDAHLLWALALVRVALGGAAILVLLAAGDIGDRGPGLRLLPTLYLPYVLVALYLSRAPRPMIWGMLVAGDLATVFLFQAFAPAGRTIVLLGYAVIVAYAAALGGLLATLAVSAAAVTGSLVAQALYDSPRSADGVTIALAGALYVSIGALVEAVTREQRTWEFRRSTEHLSGISHELRTPLASIEGFAATLTERWAALSESERLEAIQAIVRNSLAMHELVDQLLEFARADAGPPSDTMQPQDLRATVDELVERMEPMLRHHVISIEVPHVDVLVEQRAIDRVLGNLLLNAVKYSPAGSTVRIRAQPDDGEVVASVEDEGIGIRTADRPHLFDPFYRARNASETARGLGLGLAIARRTVELYGGRLWVSGAPVRGSVFWFTMPRPQMGRAPDPRPRRRRNRKDGRTGSPAGA